MTVCSICTQTKYTPFCQRCGVVTVDLESDTQQPWTDKEQIVATAVLTLAFVCLLVWAVWVRA